MHLRRSSSDFDRAQMFERVARLKCSIVRALQRIVDQQQRHCIFAAAHYRLMRWLADKL
jgi:hypothetical protein